MCDENQKRAFERKLKKDEICSELVRIREDRKSEPPPPVIKIIKFRIEKQLVCIELIIFLTKSTLYRAVS